MVYRNAHALLLFSRAKQVPTRNKMQKKLGSKHHFAPLVHAVIYVYLKCHVSLRGQDVLPVVLVFILLL